MSQGDISSVKDWAIAKKHRAMSKKLYRDFYEENCKDAGTYITSVCWKNGGGHFTIIKRTSDGQLLYIEPQWNNFKGSCRLL